MTTPVALFPRTPCCLRPNEEATYAVLFANRLNARSHGRAGANRHRPGQPQIPAGARARRCWRSTTSRWRSASASSSRCSGPRGCGKSTLLYLVGGFLPVEAGAIVVEGRPVAGARARPRHRLPAFRAVSVEDGDAERALRPRKAGACRATERARRAQAFIELVGLDGFEDSYPSQLSGGMKQRAAIARTLAIDPQHPADGRAVRRARRADPRADAGRAAGHLAALAQDRDLRHP